MKQSVKGWQVALAGAALVAAASLMWNASSQPPAPVVDATVAKGANADNALQINMDGH